VGMRPSSSRQPEAGMPLGDELVRLVIREANATLEAHRSRVQTMRQPQSLAYNTCVALGVQMRDVERLSQRLQATDGLSVDALAFEDETLAPAAKALIASVLLPMEWEVPLWSQTNAWLKLVAHRCLRHFEGSIEIGFVTFNYDRLIERRLTHFVSGLKECSIEAAWRLVGERIPIVHVHGQLGEYSPSCADPDEHQVPSHESECPGLRHDILRYTKAAAEGLLLAGERSRGGLSLAAEARKLLGSAQRIMFLGFDFAPENMARLEISKGSAKEVIYSAYDKEVGETALSNKLIRRALRGRESFAIRSCSGDCHLTVRQFKDRLPPGLEDSFAHFRDQEQGSD